MNSEDHPRACGEKSFAVVNGVQNSGSPPRMRGKGLLNFSLVVTHQDHPRICGEKSGQAMLWEHFTGSPPHMRGKVTLSEICARGSRITPAYAGKSTLPGSLDHTYRDHPRICGEKVQTLWYEDIQLGSPPHMRGKVPTALYCFRP